MGGREEAFDRAVRALGRRDHSTESLRAKLELAGVPADAQDEALERLAAAGYLDDGRFARDRAEHLAGKGYGDEWIRADLEAQGVGPEVTEAALAELEPERERAERQAVAAGDALRTARTLLRRGFSEESLEALLAGPLHSTPLEE